MALSHEERPYPFMGMHPLTLLPAPVLAERVRHRCSIPSMLPHDYMTLKFRVQIRGLRAVGVGEEVDFVRMIQSRGKLLRKLRGREHLRQLRERGYSTPVIPFLRIRFQEINLEW